MILTVAHIKIFVVIWPDKICGLSSLISNILVTFHPVSVCLYPSTMAHRAVRSISLDAFNHDKRVAELWSNCPPLHITKASRSKIRRSISAVAANLCTRIKNDKNTDTFIDSYTNMRHDIFRVTVKAMCKNAYSVKTEFYNGDTCSKYSSVVLSGSDLFEVLMAQYQLIAKDMTLKN